MESTLKYSVRLITEVEQLTEALSLRFKTYKKVYSKFVENKSRPFESDAFDSRSLHLGLYCNNGVGASLAGYCRLILPAFFEKDYTSYLIKNHPEYTNKSQIFAKEKLAWIAFLAAPDYEKMDNFCILLEQEKIIYSETSRFILDEKHRSISLCSFFVSSLFAVCESLSIKYNFFICSVHHVPFYSISGLTLFPGIAPFKTSYSRRELVVFGTDLRPFNTKQPSIKSLKHEFEATNRIIFSRAA